MRSKKKKMNLVVPMVEQPMAVRTSSQVKREPEFLRDVASVTVGIFIFAGVIIFVATGNGKAAVIGACVIGLLIFIWRVTYVLDRPYYQDDHTKFQNIPEPNIFETIPVNSAGKTRELLRERPGRKLVYLNHVFTFTGRNVDTLRRWLLFEEGGESIRKETSAAGPGFNRLPDPIVSSNYTTARYILIKLLMVDEKTNKWTAVGRRWLEVE